MGEKDSADRAGARRHQRRTTSMSARIRAAREQFQELTDATVESVSGIEKAEDGWTITMEVLELQKVPDTVSLLATYTVDVNTDGDVVGYRRVNRYTRGRSDSR